MFKDLMVHPRLIETNLLLGCEPLEAQAFETERRLAITLYGVLCKSVADSHAFFPGEHS